MNSLLSLLQSSGDLSQSNLQVLQRFMGRWESSLFDAIIETHIMSEERLADELARLFQVHRVLGIDRADFDESSFTLLSYSQAKKWRCLLLQGDHADELLVVAADPSVKDLQEFVQTLPKSSRFAVAGKSVLEDAIDRFYPIEMQLPSLLGRSKPES